MTAEERAAGLKASLLSALRGEGLKTSSEFEAEIASAIREAEDEALEAAAVAVEGGLAFHSYAGMSAASIVRSLKSPSPRALAGEGACPQDEGLAPGQFCGRCGAVGVTR